MFPLAQFARLEEGVITRKKKIRGEILYWRRRENKREQSGDSIIIII